MFHGSPSLIRLCVHCRRSLVWWLGLGFFSAVLALLYLNGSKSLAALPDKINATYDFVIGKRVYVISKRVHWNSREICFIFECHSDRLN